MLMSDEHDRLKHTLLPVCMKKSAILRTVLYFLMISAIYLITNAFLKQQCNINHTDFAENLLNMKISVRTLQTGL